MTLTLTETLTVGEIVATHPETARVFERYGIDFCCGGKKDLKTAAGLKNVAVEAVLAELTTLLAGAAPPTIDFKAISLTELVDHIEKRYHAYLKTEFPRLDVMMNKVLAVHGREEYGEHLQELSDLYHRLKADIEPHLMKEEQILFPMIRAIEAFATGKAGAPNLHCGTVANPIRQMEFEHEVVGSILASMRKVTSEYRPPAEACNTYRALYKGFEELERDTHEHIHMENNILHPRAVELERSVR